MGFEYYKQKHTDIKNLYLDPDNWIGKETKVCGWIKNFRISGGKEKKIGFIELNDGSCSKHLQIIFDYKDLPLANKDYFNMLGFAEVQVPLITDNECESGANPFTVTTILGTGNISSIPTEDDKKTINFYEDFFKKRCYLTVSGQLHLEALVLGGLSKA